jgi:hypothetical protein
MSGESDSEDGGDGELTFGKTDNDLSEPLDEERGAAGSSPSPAPVDDAVFAHLPDDLDTSRLSRSGAADFANLEPGVLYAQTKEPYKFNRSKAQDQRRQEGLFLREPVGYGVDQVHNAMSTLYAEDKYHRSDTLELLMMVGLRHADELPDVAADLGFGMDFNQYVSKRNE